VSRQPTAVGYNKQDDAGIAQAHDLQYTPTFIVKDDGKELVRVIEKPTGTLAQDLTQGLWIQLGGIRAYGFS